MPIITLPDATVPVAKAGMADAKATVAKASHQSQPLQGPGVLSPAPSFQAAHQGPGRGAGRPCLPFTGSEEGCAMASAPW